MVSSIFKKTGVIQAGPVILPDVKILSTPITIGPGELSPGGGGLLRIWFSFPLGGGTSTGIAFLINNDLNNKIFFNADNSFEVKSNGLYWFDIPIEEGDEINLVSADTPDGAFVGQEVLVEFTFLRFQKIVFGA